MNAPSVSLFGQMLRRYRTAAGLSQEELAERANLSARAISDLERGVKLAPRKETVELLANALVLSPQKRALFATSVRPALVSSLALPPRVAGDFTSPLTPLIGREGELLAVSRLLAQPDARLITITGPGGVGKTRLALRLAEETAGDFDDGAYVVSLGAVRDLTLALPTIGRALGLPDGPGVVAFEQVAGFLCGRQALLVLDNVEHLIALASDIGALLAACPRLRMLITSRQPLRIRGEREFPLAPLRMDDAVRLFLDGVRAVQPLMDTSDADNETARRICARLDCLPLALELAAMRARTLPLPALLQRLDSALALLTVGWRDLPERQQTLRATIAWSYDLLDERERRVFRWCGVFSGGCALDAAQAICAREGEDADTVFDALAALAEKSLLLLDATNRDEARFAMLETIREYAVEALRASGEEECARARHAEYYAAFAERVGVDRDLDTRDRVVQRDMDNLRVALEWAIQRRQAALGLRLGVSLARLWYMRGYASEGEAWLRALLDLDASAEPRADASLRLEALYGASRFAMDRRDYARAQTLAEESLAMARESASASGMANALATLGHVAEARGQYAEAFTHFEASLDLGRQAGDVQIVGRAVSSLGNLARARGEYERAITYLEESLAIARTLHMTWGVINALTSLGHVACEQADYARAADLYRESLGLCAALPNEANVAWLLEGVAVIVAARGERQHAARLSGVIAYLRHESGDTLVEHAWPPYAQAVAASRAALGPGDWLRAATSDVALSPVDALAFAATLLG